MVNNVYVSAVTTDNISRHAALAWVNDTILSNLSKIEEMSTGAAYCQLTHRLFPEFINLRKVKWNCRSDLDSGVNWKLLVTAWKDIGIEKPVQVDKLIKAKFQDNFEFLQWFYKFYNANWDGSDEYDAVTARGGEPLPAGGKGPARPAVRAPAAARTAPPVAAAPARRVAPVAAAAPRAAVPAAKPATNGRAAAVVDTRHEEEILALQQQIADLEENNSVASREREYYFEKLRAVEVLCTEAGGEPVLPATILAILYETEDDVAPIDEAETEVEAAGDVAHVQVAVEAVEVDDSETF